MSDRTDAISSILISSWPWSLSSVAACRWSEGNHGPWTMDMIMGRTSLPANEVRRYAFFPPKRRFDFSFYKSKTSIRRTIYTQLPILCAADLRSPKEFAQTKHTTFKIDSRTIISPLGLIVLPSVDS